LRQNILHLDNMNFLVDSLVTYLSEAQVRNFNRWPILGKYIWPNNYIGGTYSQEIGYLKTWINQRFTWIDHNIPQPASTLPGPAVVKNLILEQNSPNPFNGSTSISYQLEQAGQVSVIIYDISGRKVRALVDAYKNAGWQSVSWDAKDDAGLKLSSGIYMYTLKTDRDFKARKLVLIQ